MSHRDMTWRRFPKAALIGVMAIWSAGCTSTPAVNISPDTLPPLARVTERERRSAHEPIDVREILAVNQQMREFAERSVGRTHNPDQRMTRLARAVLHPGTLGLRYHNRMTRTAAGAFSTANGNCLTMSILFAALAREVGLEADFYEVNVLPEWTRAGDVVFSTRHVNVGGRLSPAREYVMDFLPYQVRQKIDRRKLTDDEALGQFYNNLGAEYLAANDLLSAWQHFRKGLELAPKTGFIWSNMSVVYSRRGQLDAAEQAAVKALELDPDNTSTMNNLAALYRLQGRVFDAQMLAARIHRSQRRNPYYQFVLGERDLADERFAEGLARIKTAIRLQPQEPLFYLRAADAAEHLDLPELKDSLMAKANRLKRRPGLMD